jgi:hypothetical protein
MSSCKTSYLNTREEYKLQVSENNELNYLNMTPSIVRAVLRNLFTLAAH